MTGHGSIVHFGTAVSNSGVAAVTDQRAHFSAICPYCGKQTVAAVIAMSINTSPEAAWLRCTGCDRGFVRNDGQIAPALLPGESIEGLPADVLSAYTEARQAAGLNAFTSCELMCRKILMHVAVDKGASEGKTFVEYLDHIENSGYATPPMRSWLDLIRQHGNSSTHRLEPASRERATTTLAFTAQLLRLVYEMEFKALKFMPGPQSI